MRILKLSLVVGGALAFSSPIFADDATAPPPSAVTQPQSTAPLATGAPLTASTTADSTSVNDEIICKEQPAPTGTRFGATRICHKHSEWEQQRKDSANMLLNIQTRNGEMGH